MKKKRPVRAPKAQSFELPVRLTIAQSVELHRSLMALCHGGKPLRLDGAGVEEIDTAILQLLAATFIDAARRGVTCQWQGISATLRNSATLIGLSSILQLDRAA